MNKIDTSIKGFEYVGIKLTEQQYEDLRDLNALILGNEHRQNVPVFNIMLVLKILGLLPSEIVNEISDNQSNDNLNDNSYERLQRKFGRVVN